MSFHNLHSDERNLLVFDFRNLHSNTFLVSVFITCTLHPFQNTGRIDLELALSRFSRLAFGNPSWCEDLQVLVNMIPE